MDFAELQHDKPIQEKLRNFHNSVDKIEKTIHASLNADDYEKLNTDEKVNYDLFMAYTLNTLFWLYLRTKGLDPNKNEIKNQLNRVRQYMVKAKEAHDRNTIRPTLNKAVAGRFIKHGIEQSQNVQEEPAHKKKKI